MKINIKLKYDIQVENLEGVNKVKGNDLTSLSVEQIVDCDGFAEKDSDHADCGVYGGWPYLAFEYVKSVVRQQLRKKIPK